MSFPSSPTDGQIFGKFYFDETVGAWLRFGDLDVKGDAEVDGELDVTGDATMQLMSWYPRTRTVTGNTTATADDMVINVNAATATITIPSGLATGKRILVRKINATQGAVTLARSGSETFTRASLTSVTLNADGDFWLIEKVSSTRWELVDGCETGQNGNGIFNLYKDGVQINVEIVDFDQNESAEQPHTVSKSFVDIDHPKTCHVSSNRSTLLSQNRTIVLANTGVGINDSSHVTLGLRTTEPRNEGMRTYHVYIRGRWYI